MNHLRPRRTMLDCETPERGAGGRSSPLTPLALSGPMRVPALAPLFPLVPMHRDIVHGTKARDGLPDSKREILYASQYRVV